MSDRRYAPAPFRARAPLTPEALAEMIRISAPEGIVAVQGIAGKVSEPRSYGGDGPVVYGELALGLSEAARARVANLRDLLIGAVILLAVLIWSMMRR